MYQTYRVRDPREEGLREWRGLWARGRIKGLYPRVHSSEQRVGLSVEVVIDRLPMGNRHRSIVEEVLLVTIGKAEFKLVRTLKSSPKTLEDITGP